MICVYLCNKSKKNAHQPNNVCNWAYQFFNEYFKQQKTLRSVDRMYYINTKNSLSHHLSFRGASVVTGMWFIYVHIVLRPQTFHMCTHNLFSFFNSNIQYRETWLKTVALHIKTPVQFFSRHLPPFLVFYTKYHLGLTEIMSCVVR